MQKTGVIEKTGDTEFDQEERRIRDNVKQVERVQREGKACLDAMKILAGNKVSDDLVAFGLGANEMPRYKEMWKMIEEMMNNELVSNIFVKMIHRILRFDKS